MMALDALVFVTMVTTIGVLCRWSRCVDGTVILMHLSHCRYTGVIVGAAPLHTDGDDVTDLPELQEMRKLVDSMSHGEF